MTPDEIAAQMNRALAMREAGQWAILPAEAIQSHAAFLSRLPDGALVCAWFGGTLEGKSDISICVSILDEGSDRWGPVARLTVDAERSERNPGPFTATGADAWLFNTAQPPQIRTNPASSCASHP